MIEPTTELPTQLGKIRDNQIRLVRERILPFNTHTHIKMMSHCELNLLKPNITRVN